MGTGSAGDCVGGKRPDLPQGQGSCLPRCEFKDSVGIAGPCCSGATSIRGPRLHSHLPFALPSRQHAPFLSCPRASATASPPSARGSSVFSGVFSSVQAVPHFCRVRQSLFSWMLPPNETGQEGGNGSSFSGPLAGVSRPHLTFCVRFGVMEAYPGQREPRGDPGALVSEQTSGLLSASECADG